jgi:hypothetical protein
VHTLTRLKLKAQSPCASHFNIELANGAEGYIPTPEQHVLGGYTTWPARTADLEVQAEPKIVAVLLGALEEATGRKRRIMQDEGETRDVPFAIYQEWATMSSWYQSSKALVHGELPPLKVS